VLFHRKQEYIGTHSFKEYRCHHGHIFLVRHGKAAVLLPAIPDMEWVKTHGEMCIDVIRKYFNKFDHEVIVMDKNPVLTFLTIHGCGFRRISFIRDLTLFFVGILIYCQIDLM